MFADLLLEIRPQRQLGDLRLPANPSGLCAPKLKPCHRLLPVNVALAAQGLEASDVITLACLPNGLLASSSGDSTIQLWDPARPDAAHRRSSTRCLRADQADAGLHEADKPDIQCDLMGTEVDTVRVMA